MASNQPIRDPLVRRISDEVRRTVRRAADVSRDEGILAVLERAVRKVARLASGGLIGATPTTAARMRRLKLLAARVCRAAAASEHAAGGLRPPEEVEHILASFCGNCPHFSHGRCARMPGAGSARRRLAHALASRGGECPAQQWPPPLRPEITRLNLIYHIAPLRHPQDVWQWNVAQLLERIHLFNGRRIVTIATADGSTDLDPLDAVLQALAGHDLELMVSRNSAALRETKHFQRALRSIASANPHEALFFGHTKGVTRANLDAVFPWAAAMYRHNLDRIDLVRELLRTWPCLGITKRYGEPDNFPPRQFYPDLAAPAPPGRRWHFSGTFWWVRHDALFGRPGWDAIPDHPYAVESYLANYFRADEALCLVHDDCVDAYDPLLWQSERGADVPPRPDVRLRAQQAA